MSVRLLSAEPTDLFAGPVERPRQVLRVTVVRGDRETPLEVRGDGMRGDATVPAGQGAVTLEVPLAADATTRPLWENNAFALVEAHIELALRDPDYRFVLAEVDYLKPFLDTRPERRADLRALLAEGRAELVGGTYNEPNTNLTGAETTIRNLVYGIGYQRDILGGDPRTAWQLDVFGHDPQFPGYLAAAGLTASAWARGPFHQWGPISRNYREAGGDATVMQFPSEFEWIAPSGLGVLTHYMPAHYSAGWWMDSAPTLEEAMAAVYELYRSLKPVAATRNVLLPVGTDYTPPNKWVTEIHRAWNARYVWPRFVCGTPRDFLDAVRTEISSFSPQSRDMNPIYTGKDVSYIDTKQAQRAAEVAALDAERLSAPAALLGLGRYPHTALDKVWRQLPGTTIANERWRAVADPARGGALTSVTDLAGDRELLTGLGNELRLYEEYPQHPDMGEGPWHLTPTGRVIGSAGAPASVRAEVSPIGQRIVVTGQVGEVSYEQTVTLLTGSDRVDFTTRVLDYTGADRLLRVRFPARVEGALPVSDVAGAVVGRGFALPDADSAEHPWTLDNPAHTWFGLSSTARVDLGPAGARAIGVAEIVVPSPSDAPRELVAALARAGVTATTSTASGTRYGWLDVDSNLPDVRIVLGGPDTNPVTAELLSRCDPAFSRALESGAPRVWIPAERPLPEVWQPSADLRDLRALPALIVTGPLDELIADAATAVIPALCPLGAERLDDRTVALLTYGLPGFAVDPSGALHLSLMRSSTGWPSGVWIDPPRRTGPDGASFQLQHWTHEFSYALAAGPGDWRAHHLPSAGQEFTTPLLPRVVDAAGGALPQTHSLLRVEPERDVLVSTLKVSGNPHAHGRARHDDESLTLRLVEATGLDSTAAVHSPLFPETLLHADLLEHPTGTSSGTGEVRLGGAEVGTFLVPVQPEEAGPELGAVREVAQPVYARYWLHNKGPAPLGYLPVSVTVTPGLVTPGGPFEVEVVVASHLTDAAHEGVVELLVPEGWEALPTRRPFRVEPGGHLRFPVTVTPAPGRGLYFVTARTGVGGQMIEDVATVALGDAPEVPVPGPVPDPADAVRGTTATEARPTGLTATTLTGTFTLHPGDRTTLTVRLTNTTQGEIRGEAQLAAPWGTWDLLPDVIRGFTVPAGGTRDVTFPVEAPEDASSGHFWALPKVMWFGRCQYAATVRLEVTR
ncbi:NEW3 domain-containing protein [Nonomuraea sp. NPDC049649]|uniref:glycoside hydrolase family 38 N-terminal domain-containing protein n=1 Tax=Nonomuraea sp. NPDC049649 TaxID=3155776 RepID=UPI003440B2B9